MLRGGLGRTTWILLCRWRSHRKREWLTTNKHGLLYTNSLKESSTSFRSAVEQPCRQHSSYCPIGRRCGSSVDALNAKLSITPPHVPQDAFGSFGLGPGTVFTMLPAGSHTVKLQPPPPPPLPPPPPPLPPPLPGRLLVHEKNWSPLPFST